MTNKRMENALGGDEPSRFRRFLGGLKKFTIAGVIEIGVIVAGVFIAGRAGGVVGNLEAMEAIDQMERLQQN